MEGRSLSSVVGSMSKKKHVSSKEGKGPRDLRVSRFGGNREGGESSSKVRPMEAGMVRESGEEHHDLSNNLETMIEEAMKENEEDPKSEDAELMSRVVESELGTNRQGGLGLTGFSFVGGFAYGIMEVWCAVAVVVA
ncbi:hypothetical protein U1Q18_042246 [Sarracenia purpurea var. burkii]